MQIIFLKSTFFSRFCLANELEAKNYIQENRVFKLEKSVSCKKTSIDLMRIGLKHTIIDLDDIFDLQLIFDAEDEHNIGAHNAGGHIENNIAPNFVGAVGGHVNQDVNTVHAIVHADYVQDAINVVPGVVMGVVLNNEAEQISEETIDGEQNIQNGGDHIENNIPPNFVGAVDNPVAPSGAVQGSRDVVGDVVNNENIDHFSGSISFESDVSFILHIVPIPC